jgi:SCY1-like protein 1
MRHPNILAFRDTAEVEEKGGTAIYIVTEPVQPLAMVLEELKLEGTQRWDFFCFDGRTWGPSS